MTDEVVVERGQLAAPDAAIAVGALAVTGVVQAFANGAPLHREVIVVIERSHLVDAPREGTVVEHDARLLALPGGIGTVVRVFLLSATETDKADDVVSARPHGVIA